MSSPAALNQYKLEFIDFVITTPKPSFKMACLTRCLVERGLESLIMPEDLRAKEPLRCRQSMI